MILHGYSHFMFGESHCVKSVRIRSYSGPHFPAFGLNAGKMKARITPNTDTFYSVGFNKSIRDWKTTWNLYYSFFTELLLQCMEWLRNIFQPGKSIHMREYRSALAEISVRRDIFNLYELNFLCWWELAFWRDLVEVIFKAGLFFSYELHLR